MKKLSVILLGKNGFLGSHIFDLLNTRKIDTISFSVRNKFDWIDIYQFVETSDKKFHIINASWKDTKIYNPSCSSMRNNLEIQINLLNIMKSKNVVRFINFGTYNEYGKIEGILTEDLTELQPVSNYAKLKYAIFKRAISSQYSNKYLHLRISNIYGERQDPTTLFGSIVNFNNFPENKILFNDLKLFRDYLHVDMFCRIILDILENKCFGILNLGSGLTVSHRDFIFKKCFEFGIAKKNIVFKKSNLDHQYMSENFILSTWKLNQISKLDIS